MSLEKVKKKKGNVSGNTAKKYLELDLNTALCSEHHSPYVWCASKCTGNVLFLLKMQ